MKHTDFSTGTYISSNTDKGIKLSLERDDNCFDKWNRRGSILEAP